MTGPAIVLMLIAIIVIWGGLAASIIHLSRSTRHQPPNGDNR